MKLLKTEKNTEGGEKKNGRKVWSFAEVSNLLHTAVQLRIMAAGEY